MADVRIKDLPTNSSPSPSQFVGTDLATTQKLTIQALVDTGAPVASQAEAEAGVNSTKRMTPLTTKQAIAAQSATTEQVAQIVAIASALSPATAYTFSVVLGQTSVGISGGYQVGKVSEVFLNGVRISGWTATDGDNVTFSAITADDLAGQSTAELVVMVGLPTTGFFALDQRMNPAAFTYDGIRSLLISTPYSYTETTGLFPPAGHNLTMFMSPGGHLTGVANRSTFYGTNGPLQISSFDRVNGTGDQSLRWARLVERVDAYGSLTLPWLSSNNPDADNHAWWHDTAFKPGEVGWDAGDGMEVRNPGIGAQIAAFSDFVTDRTQASRVAAFGRNAGGATVRDINSAYYGYRAGGGVYVGSKNAAFGADSLYNGVFVTEFTAIGAEAARYWQQGTRNLVGGRAAAANVVRGSYSTVLGPLAGDPFTDLTDSVLIGLGAGNNIPGAVQSDIFALGNRNKSTLMSGRFDTSRMGVNVLPADLMGNWHVRSGQFGGTAANSNADELVIEASGNGGLSILTPNTAQAQILFGDPEDQNVGGIIYDHPTNIMYLRVGDANRFAFSATGVGFNGASPALPTGVAVTAAGIHAALVTLGLITA